MTASPAANSASAAPWWRRLFGGGGEPRARMPWNAAFATVLVAGFVAVLWHREPVPDARLDGEARVGRATAQAPVPVAPPATAPAQAADGGRASSRSAGSRCASPRSACRGATRQGPGPARFFFLEKAADAASADALQRAAPKPSLKQAAPAPVAPPSRSHLRHRLPSWPSNPHPHPSCAMNAAKPPWKTNGEALMQQERRQRHRHQPPHPRTRTAPAPNFPAD